MFFLLIHDFEICALLWPLSYCFLCLIPQLSAILCSQSAVVSAPYRRWVEELSWETKRTEEERQVGKGDWKKEGLFLGGWENAVAQRKYERHPFHQRKGKMESRHLRWIETTGMSEERWSRCVCLAHLRLVWSKETEVCSSCFAPLWLFIEAQSDST